MRITLTLIAATLLVLAGCPVDGGAPVRARITISASRGPAPLTINVSAASSTSANGGPLTFLWDFGDGTAIAGESLSHTYTAPGRYVVQLRATDPTGASDVAAHEVRVEGSGAVAVIQADVTSGPAPLLVRFDGTGSSAPDDTIRDYFWDFGDGTTAQLAAPQHLYTSSGTYTVTLRVATAGGVEATSTTTITVGQSAASLQFDGASFATLPLVSGSTSARTLGELAFEAWIRAESEGGTVVSIGGGALILAVEPSSNTIRLSTAGASVNATASNLTRVWRHLAIVYSASAGTAAIYLDGSAIDNLTVSGNVTVSQLVLGNGYRGKIAEVRFWETARTANQIADARNQRLGGGEAGLLGGWPLDEGGGQQLGNLANPSVPGVLGSTSAVENTDPAWSTDTPPL